MQFFKIATLLFPDINISGINLNATVGGEAGVEVFLFGYADPYQFTGQYGKQAYDLLQNVTPAKAAPIPQNIVVMVNGQPITAGEITTIDGETVGIVIDGKSVAIADIEWADLAASINGVTGVEFRVRSDAPNMTRQIVGKEAAGDAYDILVALAGEQVQAAA